LNNVDVTGKTVSLWDRAAKCPLSERQVDGPRWSARRTARWKAICSTNSGTDPSCPLSWP